MSFPAGATNGQTTTLNGVVYTYDSTKNTWDRQGTGSTAVPVSYAGNVSYGNISTAGGVTYHNLYHDSNPNARTALSITQSTTPPSNAEVGDEWYDTSSDLLYKYTSDGVSSYWIAINPTGLISKYTTSSSVPTYSNPGDQWYDTSTDTLYTYLTDGVSSYWFSLSNYGSNANYITSSTPPTGVQLGTFWYDTSADTLYIRSSDGVSTFWLFLR